MGKEDGIFDQAGQPHTIKFDRAEEVKIYVKAELSVNEMFDFNGEEQVKAEIIKYIGGSHNGSMYTGLNMGESVVYAKLVNVIVSFPGVEDVNLQIMGSKSEEAGEDGYRKENVTIEKNQVPQAFKIEVKRKTEGGKVNA